MAKPKGNPVTPTPPKPLAIIGAAGRLPGAGSLPVFADLLRNGIDAVTQLPQDRFDQSRWWHPIPGTAGRSHSFAAGTINDISRFDAEAFGLSPREASEMDPQQRLLLEVARDAFEDAGLAPETLAGRRIAVFIGGSSTDFAELRYADPAATDRFLMTGNALSILANRLSHVFDLRGGAQTIDTACSSSLVALHMAARALAEDASLEAVVVGGVNLLLSPYAFIGFARAGMLSPSGRCHVFDAAADGYVRGEGAGVVILRRLADAEAAHEPIRALLLGTATNTSGRTIGISLPNQEAQASLLRRLLAQSAVHPDRFLAFEAHGTGTRAGDPAEAWAIGEAIARHRSTKLPIGSVKANIGHLEAGAGMAGLLKSLLMLEQGFIPPALHFDTPNPEIDFAGLNLAVPRRIENPVVPHDAVIGVNAFGFGGTNAAVLLGRAPATRKPREEAPGGSPPLILSATSAEALRIAATNWREHLKGLDAAQTHSLARGQARHRDLAQHRLVLRGRDGDDLAAQLAAWQTTDGPGKARQGQARRGKLALVFSGNGAQYPLMAEAAWRHSAAFRRGVKAIDRLLAPALGFSPAQLIKSGVTAAHIARTDFAQPLLFTVQIGIVAALTEQGIKADMVIGHSVGEVAAAYVAGILTREDAAKLILARSRHQHSTRGAGRMAAIGASVAAISPMLEDCGPGLEIAAVNGPAAVTIAGPTMALAKLCAAAEAARYVVIPLDLDYAFHAASMDPVRDGLLADLAGLQPAAGHCLMISSVTGQLLPGTEAGAAYWWRNLREPVQFESAVTEAARNGARLFIEIGPAPVLQSYMRESLRAGGIEATLLPSLTRRDAPTEDPFPAIADQAVAYGADPRSGRVFHGPATRAGLPMTPFARRPIPLPRSVESARITDAAHDHPLLGYRQGADIGQWRLWLDTEIAPWLGDHRLFGQATLPATAMAEMALAAAALRYPEAPVLHVTDLAILRPITLPATETCHLRISTEAEGSFKLEARRRLSDEPWSASCRAQLGGLPRLPPPAAFTLHADQHRTGAEIISLAARHGLDYGPAFHALQNVEQESASGRGVARLNLPATAPAHSDFHLHPVLFDGALQALLAVLMPGGIGAGEALIPVRIGRLCAKRHAAPIATAEITPGRRGERLLSAHMTLRDADGKVVACVEDIWFQRVELPGQSDLTSHSFRLDLEPIAPDYLPAVPCDMARLLDAAQKADAAASLSDIGLLLQAYVAAQALPALRDAASLPLPYQKSLWHILQRADAAEPLGQRWRVIEDQPLPPPRDIWQAVLAEQPALAPDLAWLARASETLAESLRGGIGYAEPPPALGGAFSGLAETLLAGLSALAEQWPQDRPLRLLEIGAGGALTQRVLTRLGRLGLPVHYHAIGEARAGALSHVPPNISVTWNGWDSLTTSDPARDKADVILGLAPGAMTRRGPAILQGLAALAAPGAILWLAEPAPGALWNFVCGQDPSWWQEDPEGGLVDGLAWRNALTLAGWQGIELRALTAAPWPALLLAARMAFPVAAPNPMAENQGRVLLMADACAADLAPPLAEALAAQGGSPEILPLHPPPAPHQLRGAKLVVLTRLATPATTLAAISTLAAAADGSAHGLVLVAQAEEARAAALTGLGRVLANEMPQLKPRRLSLAPELPRGLAVTRLCAELLARHPAPEVLLTATGCFAPHWRQGLPTPPLTAPAQLVIRKPGQLSSLSWQNTPLHQRPGPGEVRLRVIASGLNFRDLMWAQAMLPEDLLLDGFAGPTLGMECAGIVEEVGAGVALQPGTAVFGFAPAALASHVLTRAEALAPLPTGLAPEAAATIPVAFITATYALETLARLRPGEKLLIHGGAGGLGLAAIQIAKAAGALVAASAGSAEKRAFLTMLGVDLVLDSRDAGFADALRAAWPEGVDVVLNALAGDAMEQSLALLAPFGRFIELGKRDFAEGRRAALRPLRRNVSYFAVDADALPRAKPALAQALLADIAARLADGVLLPLPYRVFPPEEVEAAFRSLQASNHIGKLVIHPPPLTEQRVNSWEADAQGLYVIFGGTDGFGLECAKFLAASGARRLALISRRGGATPGMDAKLRLLAALGAQATAHGCDVTDKPALQALLAKLRADGAPIRGIVQAATVFADGAATQQDAARFSAVLAPKLIATKIIEDLTVNDPLHLFLLFSSATTAIGNPGQANYVAANAALEAIARRRHARGKPALAIGWGPIADAGVLTRNKQATEHLARRAGARAMAAQQALGLLPTMLASGAPVIHLADIAWAQLRSTLPLLAEPAYATLHQDAAAHDDPDQDLLAKLRALPAETARETVLALAQEEIAKILRLPLSAIQAEIPLPDLGLDSLGGVELRLALERRLGITVPLGVVSAELTLALLVKRMMPALLGQSGALAAAEALLTAHETDNVS